MSYANRFTRDQELTEAEWEEVCENDATPKNIVGISCQFDPGVAFQSEYLGHDLYLYPSGDVFEQACGFSLPQDFLTYKYRGVVKSAPEFLDILVNLIINQQVETAVALNLHYEPKKFGAIEEEFEQITYPFWFQVGHCTSEDLNYVDLKLQELSKPYNFLADFLNNPLDEKFSKFLNKVLNEKNFASVYKK